MERDLCKFYECVEIRDKEFSKYKDDKGNMFIFNTPYAIVRVDFMEVSIKKDEKTKMSEYNKLVFEKKIEDLDYKEITKKVLKPKSDVTGKQEDFTTIIEEEEDAVAVWNVSNGLGIYKSFIDKDKAIECAEKINEMIFKNY